MRRIGTTTADDMLVGVPRKLCLELRRVVEAQAVKLTVDMLDSIRARAKPAAARERTSREQIEALAETLDRYIGIADALGYQGQPEPDFGYDHVPTLHKKLLELQREGVRIRDYRLRLEAMIKERAGPLE